MTSLPYREVGATRSGPLPAGYRHLSLRRRIGKGEDVFDTAAKALLTWQVHRAAGLRTTASQPRATPGVRLVNEIGYGPLRMRAPCQVVWSVEDDSTAGFAHGTRQGHPFHGEESFVVECTADGQVWFTITSFSRPARWYMRLAGPLSVPFQRAFARRYATTLRRITARPRP